jgi:hypothetical protein
MIKMLMTRFDTYLQLNIIYCFGCDNMSFPKRGTEASVNSSEHTDIQGDQKASVLLMITIEKLTSNI